MNNKIDLQIRKIGSQFLPRRINVFESSKEYNLIDEVSKAASLMMLDSPLPNCIVREDRNGCYFLKNNSEFLMGLKAFLNDEFALSDSCFFDEFKGLKLSELPNRPCNKIMYYEFNVIIVKPTETVEVYLEFLDKYNSL
jgi:hypothetical protein